MQCIPSPPSVIATVISLHATSGGLTQTRAGTLFFDDFNAGASPAWSNDAGNWIASGGVYRTQNPNNFPNSHSFVSIAVSH